MNWPALLVAFAWCVTARAEIVTLFADDTPPAATSQAFTNLYTRHQPPGDKVWIVTVRSNEVARLLWRHSSAGLWIGGTNTAPQNPVEQFWIEEGFVIVGPGIIQRADGNDTKPATYEIKRREDFAAPGGVMTIAPDTSGPVNVSLQTSTNLIDWAPALPGQYGISTAARHFRIQVERAP